MTDRAVPHPDAPGDLKPRAAGLSGRTHYLPLLGFTVPVAFAPSLLVGSFASFKDTARAAGHGVVLVAVLLLGAGTLWWLCNHLLKQLTPLASNRARRFRLDGRCVCGSHHRNELHAALDGSPIMLLAQDRDLRVCQIHNPLPGFEGIEVLGKRDVDLWDRSDIARALEALKRQSLETGERLRRVVRIGASSGVEHVYDMTIAPLEQGGEVVGVTSAIADITAERMRAEEQFRMANNEAQSHLVELQAVIGSMTECLIIFDGAGRVLMANQAAIKLSGYASEEEFQRLTCGRDVLDLYELSDLEGRTLPASQWPLAMALRGETCSGVEIHVRRKDTGTTWIGRYSAAPVRNEAGELIRIIMTGHDVTEQRRAQEALRASELRLRRLAESGILGVNYGDDSGRIFDANDAFLDMMGYTREDLHAGVVNWRNLTPPEYLCADEKMLLEARVCGACTPYEKVLVRKNGTCVPVSVGFALLDGSESHHIAFVLDRTAQQRLEDELRTRNAQLAAADRAKDEFLAIVSHELRTPLTSILGWAQLLRRGTLPPEKRARGIEIIERNALAQTRLIDDLLDVSRIISGKLVLNVQPVDPVTVIQAAIEAVRPAAEAKSIAIDCCCEAGMVIYGDPNRLRQILYNLLSNGIKFTPRDGRVVVECRLDGREAVIAVSDTGIGIGPRVLPYVFDRFQQADQSITREHQGLGLGLAMVRHLVELHGGAISAQSAGEDQGSTFTLRLRAAKAGGEPVRAKSGGSLAGISVLVVEDEPDSREVLVLALEHYGAFAASAGTAQDALDRLNDIHPDLLLCDIGLPGEDGYTLMRKVRLRSASQGGLIPAVALTAYACAEDRAEALLAGYQDHIAKPVQVQELVAVISRLAGSGRME